MSGNVIDNDIEQLSRLTFLLLTSILVKMKGERNSLHDVSKVIVKQDAIHRTNIFNKDETMGKIKRIGRTAFGILITPNVKAWQAKTFGTTCRRITVKMKNLFVNVFWFLFPGAEK